MTNWLDEDGWRDSSPAVRPKHPSDNKFCQKVLNEGRVPALTCLNHWWWKTLNVFWDWCRVKDWIIYPKRKQHATAAAAAAAALCKHSHVNKFCSSPQRSILVQHVLQRWSLLLQEESKGGRTDPICFYFPSWEMCSRHTHKKVLVPRIRSKVKETKRTNSMTLPSDSPETGNQKTFYGS